MSNVRQKTIKVVSGIQKIDSLSIVPGSFVMDHVSDSFYILDESNATINWKSKPSYTSVSIQYRVFPLSFSMPVKRMSFDTVMYKFMLSKEKVTGKRDNQRPFDFGKISSNGSLGRSLSFGNRQDAVLNSSLNLQMNGYIGDSILLSAAITDNNIPIQPDGNTQHLKEFDQVYLKFSKDQWKLSLGDLDIRQNSMPYLNFYKRLQGVSFENTTLISTDVKNSILASGAVAKGKFTRNVFMGIEGNQGPYRLKGANQEMFFIVLAGTERVYIDGILLQRGEDQDYIINYNTAEVTFTANHMITKDKRIQIEFEYADRNYLNSQLLFTDELTIKQNLSVRAGLYNNTDAKNSPIGQSLTPDQKYFLSSIGDNLANKYYSSARPDSFSLGKILYRKVDSIYAPGKHDTIFVHSLHAQPDLYSLSFIDMGEGRGNYIQELENNSNGKVYKWIAPDAQTGNPNGRFEPVVLLAAPKAQKMVTIGTSWKISPTSNLDADLAMSSYDVNRLSSKDKANDQGMAFKSIYTNEQQISHTSFKVFSNLTFDYASVNFKPIERLRDVEFYRDWGMEMQVTPQEEKYIQSHIRLVDKHDQSITYSFEHFNRTNELNASKNALSYHFSNGSWRMDHQFDLRKVDALGRSGNFFRPTIDVSKYIKGWKNQEVGFRYHEEKNESHWLNSDSLYAGSFSFKTIEAYTKSDQTKLNTWGIRYYTRADAIPEGKVFSPKDQSQNINLDLQLLSNEHHQFKLNSTWRVLSGSANQLIQSKKTTTLLGRAQYLMDIWRGGINGDVLYEIGSGQEPRRDFAFIEVPAGQGEYTWIDYNNDGIQQVTEFEVAKFKDQAKYFRISTPTAEFIRTDYLQNNVNLVFNPSKALGAEINNAFTRMLKRMYLQSSLQLSEKKEADANRLIFPLNHILLDSTLIAFDELMSSTFSYNKNSQVWGLDLNTLQSSNRAFLSYGYETRRNRLLSARLHAYLFKVFTADFIYKQGQTQLETSTFNNRNYSIKYISYEPRLTYSPDTKFRMIGSLKFDHKTNIQLEKMTAQSIILEGKYNLVSNTSLSSKFTLNKIRFNAATNTLLSYIMLDGLLPGRNMLWNVELTKNISRMLKLSFQYEGRKAGSSGMVNIGRAQITALL